jgi:formiminoglutamase
MTVEDPQWPRASAWLAGEEAAGAGPRMAVLGAPLSVSSISTSGAHETPRAVRAALRRFSTWFAPAGVDLADVVVTDLGDLAIAALANEDAQAAIARALAEMSPRPALLVLLGGDNAITRPGLRGYAADLSRAGLLTLDAHHDVRGFHAGPSNGTPVRGLIDDGLPGSNVVQIGIGAFTNSGAHRRYAEEAGITVIGVDDARTEGVGSCVTRHLDALAQRCDMIWVDLDVDVLDSAFAPGCPGARPGGLTPAELHAAALAAGRHGSVTAIDIVEVDATADPTGVTVDNAALCLLHAAAGFALR